MALDFIILGTIANQATRVKNIPSEFTNPGSESRTSANTPASASETSDTSTDVPIRHLRERMNEFEALRKLLAAQEAAIDDRESEVAKNEAKLAEQTLE